MPSDRSDAGIRLLGYAAARRRNLLADEAQRPRRVAPRPSGLLPRSLPVVVSSRRVLPIQRGDFIPDGPRSDPWWAVPDDDHHSDAARHTAGRGPVAARNRPLISDLSDAELAREAVASLREPATRTNNRDLAPGLLDLGSGSVAGRPLSRVPSGRHRNRRGRRNIRTGWIGAAVASLIAAGTGLTAWAMTTPADVPVTQQVPANPPSFASLGSVPATASQLPQIGTAEPASPTFATPPEIVPSTAGDLPGPGAPAVVSTLGPDDPGFGWPSSAFGTSAP